MLKTEFFLLIAALDRHRSLSAAARELGLTQPGISYQVKKLEETLQVSVVLREARGVKLTEAGAVLAAHAQTILHSLRLAESEAIAADLRRSHHVRIAAFPSGASTLVVPAMAEIIENNPHSTFTLTEAEPPKAFELVEKGECDIAIVFHYTADKREHTDHLVTQRLMEERVHLALPRSHPAASSDKVRLVELQESRWIAGCEDCRGHLVSSCESEGFSPHIAFETDDYVTLQNLAAQGLGVALLPDLVLAAVRVPGLYVRPLVYPTNRIISAVTTPVAAQLSGVEIAMSTLRSTAEKTVKALPRILEG